MPLRSSPAFTRRAALGLLGAGLAMPRAAVASGAASGVPSASGRAFGTGWTLSAPGADLPPLAEALSGLFARIDRAFSPWREDSVLTRFNSRGAACYDREVAHVTGAALDIAERSGGAFDPTVGPLVARWGFGPIQAGGPMGWRALSSDGSAVWKARPDVTLDLCGIAKGWALDRAAATMARFGLHDFLIEIGGEFVARGRHPEGRDWRVAVETPAWSKAAPPILRVPSGRAVATSGVWAQSYWRGDRLYSHIIDPGTQAPIEGALRSVTVVAETGLLADAWATALCAARAATGPDLARRQGLAALFLSERDGALDAVRTGPIARYLA